MFDNKDRNWNRQLKDDMIVLLACADQAAIDKDDPYVARILQMPEALTALGLQMLAQRSVGFMELEPVANWVLEHPTLCAVLRVTHGAYQTRP